MSIEPTSTPEKAEKLGPNAPVEGSEEITPPVAPDMPDVDLLRAVITPITLEPEPEPQPEPISTVAPSEDCTAIPAIIETVVADAIEPFQKLDAQWQTFSTEFLEGFNHIEKACLQFRQTSTECSQDMAAMTEHTLSGIRRWLKPS